MMNIEQEKKALARLKAFEPSDTPYYLCYGGGKDSDVIRILADLAMVKHEIWHNHTTVDAPETVRYVRSIPGVKISYPRETMWDLIVRKMYPPTRNARYCCETLKERAGRGRVRITGVRWEESTKRKNSRGIVDVQGKPKKVAEIAQETGAKGTKNKYGGMVFLDENLATRRLVEACYKDTTTTINPIVDWSENDVWEFLKYYGCEGNPLYKCGRPRIGCIGCPLSSRQKEELELYPIYRKNYVFAFERMLIARKESGRLSKIWDSGESVMRWWVGEDPMQITLEDYLGLLEDE